MKRQTLQREGERKTEEEAEPNRRKNISQKRRRKKLLCVVFVFRLFFARSRHTRIEDRQSRSLSLYAGSEEHRPIQAARSPYGRAALPLLLTRDSLFFALAAAGASLAWLATPPAELRALTMSTDASLEASSLLARIAPLLQLPAWTSFSSSLPPPPFFFCKSLESSTKEEEEEEGPGN
jgi:hypothetical protein